ncbi:hypothetical protein ACEWY4_015058 [Coilia grayii]|uniref:LRRCT domain-containing protein n=1 Tax=Coilia grayii TaxID=363190 RepID=A0ABD1JTZ3_9TELE
MFLVVMKIWILTLSQVQSSQPCGHPTSCSSGIHIQNDTLTSVPSLPHCITRVLFLGTVETIQEKAFEGHPQLERVEFIGTSTTTVQPAAFEGLADLKVLEISGTELESLPDGIFHNLDQLVTLHLTDNKIRSVETKLFSGLGKLRDLQLKCNSIDSISSGALDGLKQLEMLDLSRNNLKAFPSQLFSHLANLQLLRASKNQLDRIPQDIWSGHLTNLEEIDIRGNNIRHLQTPKESHEKLQRLFLGNNLLNELHKEVHTYFPALKILDLQKNNISSFPQGVFSKLTQLELLDISNNQIEDLTQGSFEGLGKLMELNLEGNLIHFLQDEDFKHLQALRSLNLSKNKLKSLTGMLFEVFGKLQVSLDDNPWQCDCEMKKHINSRNYSFIIMCTYPEKVNNQSLSSLDKSLLCPTNTPAPSSAPSLPDSSSSRPSSPDSSSSRPSSPDSSSLRPSSPDSSSPPPCTCTKPTKEPKAPEAEGLNWSKVSRILVPVVAPLLALLFVFALARLYTRSRGYTVRSVDPALKPIKLVDEENCKLLYVHDLPETFLPPEQPGSVSS